MSSSISLRHMDKGRARVVNFANSWLMLQCSLQVCILILASCGVLQTASAKHMGDSHVLRDYLDSYSSSSSGSNNNNPNHPQQLYEEEQDPLSFQHSRFQRDLMASNSNINNNNNNNNKNGYNPQTECDAVRSFFKSIDIKSNDNYDEKGAACNGACCNNGTEMELRHKARDEFEILLHHHTKSLRGILESTVKLFQNHVLELAGQSENKTLNVFSQVYRRMVSTSRKLINELYSEIIDNLKNVKHNKVIPLTNLENTIENFFVNIFPMAYHQAVHLNNMNNGELHEDYNSCLKHAYEELQPFGNIPKDIKRNLMQSIQKAKIFMTSLLQSADILAETDNLYALYLTETCQKQLLKMNYCPSCNGYVKTEVKICYSYCMNVLRGCSAQYASVLDSPWSNVVDAIDNLVSTHIRSDNGIVNTIKQLDGKLSETIMRVMENGPELEKKIKNTCGIPRLTPYTDPDPEVKRSSPYGIKWATPPEADILRFLSTIEKSKDFYSMIVNNICEDDDDVQHSDHHCWTGERIGDYTQLVMTIGADTQRYNPEVPLEKNIPTGPLYEVVDKMLKISKNIGTAVPSTARSHSDIQGDMARHDEEGSGHMPDDVDDEEYGNLHGSGDGSGDGPTTSPFDPTGPPVITSNDIEQRSSATSLMATIHYSSLLLTVLVTIALSSRHLAAAASVMLH